ncbi:MAG: PepSY domain-containing protein [Planctomycetota bacterium]
MKFVRRVHMYFGLVLTPFVLLYGVTALLFNHPGVFSKSESIRPPDEVLAEIVPPSAEDIANAAFSAITSAIDRDVRRVDSDEARWIGEFVIDATTDESRSRFRLAPDTLEFTARLTPSTPEPETPFPPSVQTPGSSFTDAVSSAISGYASADSVRIRSTPDVEFHVIADGREWIVLIDAGTGAVSARPRGDPRRAFDVRSFLLRLHVSHGYPMSMSARWIWAVIVDVMAGLMIFWALSGLMMWWQMKPTRTAGAVVVAGGLAVAGVLGYAMLQLLYY